MHRAARRPPHPHQNNQPPGIPGPSNEGESILLRLGKQSTRNFQIPCRDDQETTKLPDDCPGFPGRFAQLRASYDLTSFRSTVNKKLSTFLPNRSVPFFLASPFTPPCGDQTWLNLEGRSSYLIRLGRQPETFNFLAERFAIRSSRFARVCTLLSLRRASTGNFQLSCRARFAEGGPFSRGPHLTFHRMNVNRKSSLPAGRTAVAGAIAVPTSPEHSASGHAGQTLFGSFFALVRNSLAGITLLGHPLFLEPFRMETSGLVHPLVGVRAEEVTLRLE